MSENFSDSDLNNDLNQADHSDSDSAITAETMGEQHASSDGHNDSSDTETTATANPAATDDVFVIRNQDLRYLTKKHQWRSGLQTNELFRAKDRDVALNELIEVNAKDIMARLELVEATLNKQRHPVVEVLADDPEEVQTEGDLFDGDDSNDAETHMPHLELVQNNHSAGSVTSPEA